MADEWVFSAEMKPWKNEFINSTGKTFFDIRTAMM
jgi:hypothetical protein